MGRVNNETERKNLQGITKRNLLCDLAKKKLSTKNKSY